MTHSSTPIKVRLITDGNQMSSDSLALDSQGFTASYTCAAPVAAPAAANPCAVNAVINPESSGPSEDPSIAAGLDEGLLSFCLPHSRL